MLPLLLLPGEGLAIMVYLQSSSAKFFFVQDQCPVLVVGSVVSMGGLADSLEVVVRCSVIAYVLLMIIAFSMCC